MVGGFSFECVLALTIDKEAWVVDIWNPLAKGGQGRWNPCFLRSFNDRELEEAECFLGRLHGNKVCGDDENMVFCSLH